MFKKILLLVFITVFYAVAMEEQPEKHVFKNELCELLYNLMNKDCAADVKTKTTEFLLFKSITNKDISDAQSYAACLQRYIHNQYAPCLAIAEPVGPFNYQDAETEKNRCLERVDIFCKIIGGQFKLERSGNERDVVRQRTSVIGTLDS